jgi:hypothetical protein
MVQAAKDEEWESKLKLGNQFRGLHEEEFEFLSRKDREKQEAEAKWRSEEKQELAAYREYVRSLPGELAPDPPWTGLISADS